MSQVAISSKQSTLSSNELPENSVLAFNRTPDECNTLVAAFTQLNRRRQQESFIDIEQIATMIATLETNANIDLGLLEIKLQRIEDELEVAAIYGPLEQAINAFRAECGAEMKGLQDGEQNKAYPDLMKLYSTDSQRLAVGLAKAEVNGDKPPVEFFDEIHTLRTKMNSILSAT